MEGLVRDIGHVHEPRREHSHAHAHQRLSEHSHQIRRVQPRILQRGQLASDKYEIASCQEQVLSETDALVDVGSGIDSTLSSLTITHEQYHHHNDEHRVILDFEPFKHLQERDAVPSPGQTSSPGTQATAVRTEVAADAATQVSTKHSSRRTKVVSTHSRLPTNAPLVPEVLSAASIENILTQLPPNANTLAAISSILEGAAHTAAATSPPLTTSATSPAPTEATPTSLPTSSTSTSSTSVPGTPSSSLTSSTSSKTSSSTAPPTVPGGIASTSSTLSTSSTSTSLPLQTSTFGIPTTTSSAPSSTISTIPTSEKVHSPGSSAGAIAGGVVGGVVGLFLLLLLIFFLVRYFRRKRHEAPTALHSREPSGSDHPNLPAAPQATFVPGAAAGFINRLSQSRSSQRAPSSGLGADAQPRSFERLSGRKLPSQFSPGIEGPTREPGAAIATGMHYPSGSSAYPSGGTFLSSESSENPFHDRNASGGIPSALLSSATVAATRGSNSRGSERTTTQGENLRPGPAHTPILHSGTSDETVPRTDSASATRRAINEAGVSRTPTPADTLDLPAEQGNGLHEGLGMGIGFARGGAATPPRAQASRTVSYDGSVRSGRGSRFIEDI